MCCCSDVDQKLNNDQQNRTKLDFHWRIHPSVGAGVCGQESEWESDQRRQNDDQEFISAGCR